MYQRFVANPCNLRIVGYKSFKVMVKAMAKYIVVNENLLAYILNTSESLPGYTWVQVVHGSILRGYNGPAMGLSMVCPGDTVRDAVLKDFEDYSIQPPKDMV